MLLFLFLISLTIAIRSLTHILIKRSIKRLAISKTYHCTDLFHILICLLYTSDAADEL